METIENRKILHVCTPVCTHVCVCVCVCVCYEYALMSQPHATDTIVFNTGIILL